MFSFQIFFPVFKLASISVLMPSFLSRGCILSFTLWCVLIRIVTKILQKMAFQTKPSAEVLQNSVNWMCGLDVV